MHMTPEARESLIRERIRQKREKASIPTVTSPSVEAGVSTSPSSGKRKRPGDPPEPSLAVQDPPETVQRIQFHGHSSSTIQSPSERPFVAPNSITERDVGTPALPHASPILLPWPAYHPYAGRQESELISPSDLSSVTHGVNANYSNHSQQRISSVSTLPKTGTRTGSISTFVPLILPDSDQSSPAFTESTESSTFEGCLSTPVDDLTSVSSNDSPRGHSKRAVLPQLSRGSRPFALQIESLAKPCHPFGRMFNDNNAQRNCENEPQSDHGNLAPPHKALPGIVDVLSSYQRDMFSTLPTNLAHKDYRLLSYWMNRFPSMVSLDTHPKVLKKYNRLRDVFFQFALANELAFETLVLGFAAYHIDNLVGFGDVEYLEKHRLKALQLTRQRVEALNSHGLSNDGDLVGFIALVYLECNLGDKALGVVHLGALRKYCRLRRLNGIFATKKCTDTLVQWGCANNVASSYANIATDKVILAEFLSDFSDLRAFFEESRRVTEALRRAIFIDESNTKTIRRPSAFAPGSLLYSVLSKIPNSTQGEELRRYKYCQLLVLIHINKALIDRQDSPQAIDVFIKDLLRVFLELDLDKDPNPLYCCFWSLIHDPALHDMKMQKKYRIYQPCKTLRTPELTILCDALLTYLAMGASLDSKRSDEASLPSVDFVYVEREALQAIIEANKQAV